MKPNLPLLLAIVIETRGMLLRPENDFTYSRWRDSVEATADFDTFVSELHLGILPENLAIEFAAASSTQQVSISSGWAHEFLSLVERFTKAMNGA